MSFKNTVKSYFIKFSQDKDQSIIDFECFLTIMFYDNLLEISESQLHESLTFEHKTVQLTFVLCFSYFHYCIFNTKNSA